MEKFFCDGVIGDCVILPRPIFVHIVSPPNTFVFVYDLVFDIPLHSFHYDNEVRARVRVSPESLPITIIF
jgi:hypothetical protein